MHNKPINRPKTRLSMNHWGTLSATAAGVLYALAFAPFDYAYFAPLALVILFASWRGEAPTQALLRGYLFGFASFGMGVSWVYISMHDFGRAGWLTSGLLTGLFVAFWSLFPALAGYLAAKIVPHTGPLIGLPSIWLLVDYIRGHIVLNGFPWLLCAYSQLQTPLSGYIPVSGVYGTGFLLAFSASGVVALCHNKGRRALFAAMLTMLWGIGAVLQNIQWTHGIGDPFRVSLIQGSVTQDKKWLPEFRQKTLRLYQIMTEAHWDSAIIIWPETAIPAYLEEVYRPFLLPLSYSAKQHNSDLVISVPAHGRSQDEKYNAVITLGKETGMYRKKHLLPFGEYLPWQPLSGTILSRLNMRLGNFSPGKSDQPLLKAGGYRFSTSICYEDAFGDAAIRDLPEAAFMVNVTNDGWFGDSIEPHQHLQIARMRAMETGRFLLRATNTGATAIIGPDGGIISQAPLFHETALTGFIIPMAGTTPYARIGDKPIIILIFSLLTGRLIFCHYVRHNRRQAINSTS